MSLRNVKFEDLPAEVRLLAADMAEYSGPYLVQPTSAWAWDASDTCPAGVAFHAIGRPDQVLLGFKFEGEKPEIRLHCFKDLRNQRGIPDFLE